MSGEIQINRELFVEGIRAARPPRRRTMREFAEAEVLIPTGPRRGLKFSTAFMPWTGIALDAFENPRWRRFFLAGPAQSGKTLIGFQIPILFHLFEMGETIIVGLPDMDLAQGIWDERLLPIIEGTR